MNITDHFMTKITCCSLNALSDNCRTKMTYMKRFRYIGSTIIDHDRLRLLCFITAKQLIFIHFIHEISQKSITDRHIDKSGHLSHNLLKSITL